MPEELIVRHCSPTLAGIKTGNIIACHEAGAEENRDFVRYLNSILVPKGLRAMLFSRGGDRSEMIYVYRPEKLKKDLSDETAREILKKADYPVDNATHCVIKLLQRLRQNRGFPHEIGLFLGYPAVDVRGFIRHGECKCTGLWKVYESDTDQAQKMFARCRHCTKAYLQRNREGWSLSRLTIQPRQFSYHEAERLERKETA